MFPSRTRACPPLQAVTPCHVFGRRRIVRQMYVSWAKAGLINYKAIIKVREHIIKPQLSEQIDIQHNSILPQWNYTIRPSLTTCANPN